MILPEPNQFGSYYLSDKSVIHTSKKLVKKDKEENEVVSNNCYFMLACIGSTLNEKGESIPLRDIILEKGAIKYVKTPQEAMEAIESYKKLMKVA